jgi:hypothetical protein
MQDGEPVIRPFLRVGGWLTASDRSGQPGEEPRPAVLVQHAEISGQAGVNQPKPVPPVPPPLEVSVTSTRDVPGGRPKQGSVQPQVKTSR